VKLIDDQAAARAARMADASRAAARALHARNAPSPSRQALALDPEGTLWLKLESFQPTGSFKVRGALHRIGALEDAQRKRGIVAASTGNHGAAVAYAAALEGVRATVIVPVGTPAGRVRAIEARGAAVLQVGAECGEAEAAARVRAAETGETFVSPYNDEVLVAGQGTLGVELLDQIPNLGRVYIAAGGGGLIGGVAAVLADADPTIEVVGCSPRASCSMHESVAAGRVVETPHEPTLSLATAGALEEGSVTLQPCIDFVHRWELVDEAEMAAALRSILEGERLLVEGAAAVALAVRMRDSRPADGRVDCVVICGGNLDIDDLRSVLASSEAGS